MQHELALSVRTPAFVAPERRPPRCLDLSPALRSDPGHPMTHFSGNQYAGQCRYCGEMVAAGEGVAYECHDRACDRHRGPRHWHVRHHSVGGFCPKIAERRMSA
jgi:hypothetical protein